MEDLISGQLSAWIKGIGSANPLVSIIIDSIGGLNSRRAFIDGTKSSWTVQHKHPLFNSIKHSSSVSSHLSQLLIKSPSIPTSPNSLIIKPNFLLLSFSSYLRKVVLPEPRNPETTITGIFFFIFDD